MSKWVLSSVVEMEYRGLRKIISGGQVGADRGGLEAAKLFPFPTGGWAPKGYRVDRGFAPELAGYGVLEHHSPDYPPRTKLNVVESDATVIIASNKGSPGCALTANLCKANGKPVFYLKPLFSLDQHAEFVSWVVEHQVEVLNVAGNRDKPGQPMPNIHHITADQAITWLLQELDERQLLNRSSA